LLLIPAIGKAIAFSASEERRMAEKNRPEDFQELIEEVTERVFINYEPPVRNDSAEPDEDTEQEGRAA
jgi:hypothetical protein